MNKRKLLEKALSGGSNLRFNELVLLVEAFGFEHDRTKGSHHIFKRRGMAARLNLQNWKGKAKPYQVRQFLLLVEQYNLTMREEE